MKKVTNIIKKEFDSEPLLIKKHLRAEKEINTKEGFKGIYIPVKLIDSVYRKDKNYYSQVFSEIYNFIVIEKRCLILKTDIYVDDFYNEYSDEE